jgi:uncharacterized protein YndB with AHSA1/START domain
MTDLTVNVSKTILAPITKVFDAWLDSGTLARFMMPMPGMENSEVEIEAHEGGAFTIIMQVGDNQIPHTGTYLEIDRPRKLVFTWESPASTDGSVVTLDFTELGDGKTNIKLTHVKFIDEQRRSDHEGGWSNILSKLGEEMVLSS